MRSGRFLLGCCAIALAGCAADRPVVRWSRPGATYDQFVQDRAACVEETRANSQPFFIGGSRFGSSRGADAALDTGLFAPCMNSRGYAVDPKGYAAPPGDEIPLGP